MRNIGYNFEKKATQWLKSFNYTILENNFYSSHGEIDIIAEKNNELHFIEVKGSSSKYVVPLTLKISKQKQQRLINTALTYMSSQKTKQQPLFSLITFEKNKLTFYKNIFECNYLNNEE
tara:strand:+ start:130 stop:486 length:357 start_codon:yes stop_codon:yes gene_type:complete